MDRRAVGSHTPPQARFDEDPSVSTADPTTRPASAGEAARLVLVAGLAGATVMILEIAAPRLVAPLVGTKALAWTTVIGTFLLGLALGNVLGGRAADRGVERS